MENTNVNNIDQAMSRCGACLYKDSCKNYLKNFMSNPNTEKEEMEIAIQEIIDCKDFYPINDSQVNIGYETYELNNRQEYDINYNTYVHEFYEG